MFIFLSIYKKKELYLYFFQFIKSKGKFLRSLGLRLKYDLFEGLIIFIGH